MDEDGIPPNPVCSAPPLSEPAAPVLSLSSITPSCENDGESGHRRSGRIQEIKAKTPQKMENAIFRATLKPSRQNSSSKKRQMGCKAMVEKSRLKRQRVENTHVYKKPNKDIFAVSFTRMDQNLENNPKVPPSKSDVFPEENVLEPIGENMMDDDTEPYVDTVQNIAEDTSSSKGWVIGPLFQSLKSKMASFTDIVMTPVKLFTTSSPSLSLDHLDELNNGKLKVGRAADVKHSDPATIFNLEGQTVNKDNDEETSQERLSDVEEARKTPLLSHNYSKKLKFDDFEWDDKCESTQKGDDVPLPQCPSDVPGDIFVSSSCSTVKLQPAAKVSASNHSNLKLSDAVDHQEDERPSWLKALPEQQQEKGSEFKNVNSERRNHQRFPQLNLESSNGDSRVVNFSQSSLVCHTQTDRLQLCTDASGHIESNCLIQESTRKSSTLDTNKIPPNACLAAPQIDVQEKSKTSPFINARAKRTQKVNKDSETRKRTAGVSHRNVSKTQQVLNLGLDGDIKTPRRAAVSNTVTVEQQTIKHSDKRQSLSTRANKKGKNLQDSIAARCDTNASAGMSVCSLKKTISESHNSKGNEVKTSISHKNLPTKVTFGKHDVNNSRMDLTTNLVGFIEHTQGKSQVLVSSKPIKRPLKRKSFSRVALETERMLVSTSSAEEPMSTDCTTEQTVAKDDLTRQGNQPSKRLKNSFRTEAKLSQDYAQSTKSEISNVKTSRSSGYFKSTPLEDDSHLLLLPSQLNLSCYVPMNKEDEHVMEWKKRSATSVDGVSDSGRKQSFRYVNSKQRRKCRVFHTQMHKVEDGHKSVTVEDAEVAASRIRSSEAHFSRNLSRSYSCPEILFLTSTDSPWSTPPLSPHHSLPHTPQHHHHQHHHHSHLQAQRSLRRTRRHTVCSVEVEREIAPLCLRKEVYPSGKSVQYDPISSVCASHVHSPSSFLSALASCFLSSPLAFLSKRSDCRGAASPSTSMHVPPCSPPSQTPSASSSTWSSPGCIATNDCPSTQDPPSSENPVQIATQTLQSDDDAEDTSSSSQEFEDAGLREEKSLSDSELKVVKKHEERGKVSSIRIRKALPKPQTNLTPMGLPKPIRVKKKEFSLEEIYTNKNFSKPPESRLETIFEVPLNRRNGSESWCGPRRVRRFLEFLEVGEVRKPKKPLVGVGKASASSSRTRRGGFPKDRPPLSTQDVDSLLCAKLDELNLWLIRDQKDV